MFLESYSLLLNWHDITPLEIVHNVVDSVFLDVIVKFTLPNSGMVYHSCPWCSVKKNVFLVLHSECFHPLNACISWWHSQKFENACIMGNSYTHIYGHPHGHNIPLVLYSCTCSFHLWNLFVHKNLSAVAPVGVFKYPACFYLIDISETLYIVY